MYTYIYIYAPRKFDKNGYQQKDGLDFMHFLSLIFSNFGYLYMGVSKNRGNTLSKMDGLFHGKAY